MHIRALFQLRHGRLAHGESFGHVLLGDFAGFAQFLKRHRLAQHRGRCGHARASHRREALGEFLERPMSGHGISPSFLISSM